MQKTDFISAKTEGESHVMSGVHQHYKRVPALLSAKKNKNKKKSQCIKLDYILGSSGQQESRF